MGPGARNKFVAPMFEPEVFRKQMHCIEESICDIVGTFQPPHGYAAPTAVIRPPIVIRRPGNCASLIPAPLRL